jgi:hypothetical protein
VGGLEGALREHGVRPGFWITIIAAVAVLGLALRGYWEWAAVALIALIVFNRVPFVRLP